MKKELIKLNTIAVLLAFAAFIVPVMQAKGIDDKSANTIDPNSVVLENNYLKYVISSTGSNLIFLDKKTQTNYCILSPISKFAHLVKNGRRYDVSTVSLNLGRLTVKFGESGVTAIFYADIHPEYLTLSVESIDGSGVEQLTFLDIPLTTQGTLQDVFACSILALNIQTHVKELPGPNNLLRATCYQRFGIAGAKVAFIGCPKEQLRYIMQQVASAADGLPKSDLGGPWALDADRMLTRGTYLFNFEGIKIEDADKWIDYAKKMGANQINFHGSKSFRFGDCMPNPEVYPNGFADFKTVIAKLHKAGIKAGLHTYSFFIDKKTPWVTPIPDPRLAYSAVFTLAEPLDEKTDTVPVIESTQGLPDSKTGYFVRNSTILRIGEELIEFSGITRQPPYTFTGCKRGALGTRISAHPQGTQAFNLKECFGYLVPDPNSTLWDEVAARTADAYNVCDFDMIYLDAIDAADIFTGKDDNWHYEAKFVFDLCKRLKKPAVMEMSAFSHLIWFARSRAGGWDVSKQSHKQFIDIHLAQNEKHKRLFLPTNLGWWNLSAWDESQSEFTFADDVEYLLCKSLGTDSGISVIEGTPERLVKDAYFEKMSQTIRQYETLRHEGYFPESVKDQLKTPGKEFKLEQNQDGAWQFRPASYDKHKIEGLNGITTTWQMQNQFESQPVKLRLQALCSVKPYDCPDAITLTDFGAVHEFGEPNAAPGIEANLEINTDTVKAASVSVCYTATNTNQSPNNSWVEFRKDFPSLMDLSKHKALGVWIYGDGKGEVLNFQMKTPLHLAPCIGDRYVVIDFTGWRYFELVEFEGERYEDYQWPYATIVYDIYRQSYAIYSWHLNYTGIESIGLWYNNIPAGDSVKCCISPIKALPLLHTKTIKPSISLNGKTITFDVTIESGQYLEFYGLEQCSLYSSKGQFLRKVKVHGEVPVLLNGTNEITYHCAGNEPESSVRAMVTIISQSANPIRE